MTSFSGPSISGYNSNPPEDDGSTTSTNEVTWSKHKDKLGDPLKNYADAIKSAASTSFGKTLGNAVSGKSTTYTVQTSDEGKIISCTNTFTLSLPAAATAGSDFVVGVINSGSGVITIDGDSSETINGSITQTLAAGDGGFIFCDGSSWYLLKTIALIDDDDMSDDSAISPPSQQSVKARYKHVNDASGYAAVDSTALNIRSSVTENQWWAVTPTAGGHVSTYVSNSVTWSSLDGLPSGINWIRVKVWAIGAILNGGSGNFTQESYCRKNGVNLSTVSANIMSSVAGAGNTAGDNVLARGVFEITIPVSGKCFDVNWTDNFSTGSSINLILVGYGYN